jgi:hypothetical protein
VIYSRHGAPSWRAAARHGTMGGSGCGSARKIRRGGRRIWQVGPMRQGEE